ncbi:MAG: ABC transporter ATP-binding protein, partial [Gammaproteobacteria bacterium]|nr:ABC transporter ATP-binding protein [Gammaproteobacteria bacterium]
GPNGAGKSTIFKMLCGLLPASAGTATVAGLDLRVAAAKARQSLGYMAQRFSLYGGLSVAQNLDFFSGVYGLRGRARRREVERMLTIFALEDYAQEAAENLPLGYKQRLALACALMHQPQVLFLDEPTSGVDPVTRREFWNHINGMVRKGLSIMVSTHFMDEAEYCDRIALIDRGRVIAAGSPDDLKQQASRLRGGAADDEEIDLETAFIALLQASGQRTADDANSTNGRTNGTHTSDSANIASKRTHGS